jgi:peptidoglycan L-alanyl-D-glutamate endopeptidase CwlK
MPAFSAISRDRLDTCDHRLQVLFEEVVREYDCAVLVGHRGEAEQSAAFESGKSKLRWPESKHNSDPSLAVDVAPHPISWTNTKRFYHFAGYVKGLADLLDIPIRWGGDWDGDEDLDDQNFNDLVHFELTKP